MTSKFGFGAQRKLPQINDRKVVCINAIQTTLRSLISGALARPKTKF